MAIIDKKQMLPTATVLCDTWRLVALAIHTWLSTSILANRWL